MDTCDLHFEQVGDGPPVVILHGLFGSSRNWKTVAAKLASEFNVITVDARNHGQSQHMERMNYEAMAADTLRLIEQQKLERPAIIGHSMGGKTAMTLALSAPSRLRQLIVVDIGPGQSSNDYDDILEAMSTLDLKRIKRRAEADDALKATIPNTEIRLFILQNLLFSRDAPPRWRISVAAIRNGINSLLAPIPVSGTVDLDCCFIRGENSDHVSSADIGAIPGLFPHATVETIANAGHWPHTENSDAFIGIVKASLRANGALGDG